FLDLTPPPPQSSPFPYTTLFRSQQIRHVAAGDQQHQQHRSEQHQDGLAAGCHETFSQRLELERRLQLGGIVPWVRFAHPRHVLRSEEHTSELQVTRSSRMPSSA